MFIFEKKNTLYNYVNVYLLFLLTQKTLVLYSSALGQPLRLIYSSPCFVLKPCRKDKKLKDTAKQAKMIHHVVMIFPWLHQSEVARVFWKTPLQHVKTPPLIIIKALLNNGCGAF